MEIETYFVKKQEYTKYIMLSHNTLVFSLNVHFFIYYLLYNKF